MLFPFRVRISVIIVLVVLTRCYANYKPGQHCKNHTECIGNSLGSTSPQYTHCSTNRCCYTHSGVLCNFNKECCSSNCEKKRCCKVLGRACEEDYECCKNNLPHEDIDFELCSNNKCCHNNIGATCNNNTDCCQNSMKCDIYRNKCCVGLLSSCKEDSDCCIEQISRIDETFSLINVLPIKEKSSLKCQKMTKKCCNDKVGVSCNEDNDVCCDSLLAPNNVNFTQCVTTEYYVEAFTYCLRMNYGAQCTEDWHCKRGICIGNICVGKVGDECSEDKECHYNQEKSKLREICNIHTKKCCKTEIQGKCEKDSDCCDNGLAKNDNNYTECHFGRCLRANIGAKCNNGSDCMSNECSVNNKICCNSIGGSCTNDNQCCHSFYGNISCSMLIGKCCIHGFEAKCTKDSDCCYNSLKKHTDPEYMQCSDDSKCVFVNQTGRCETNEDCFPQICSNETKYCCSNGIGSSCSNDYNCCYNSLTPTDSRYMKCSKDSKKCHYVTDLMEKCTSNKDARTGHCHTKANYSCTNKIGSRCLNDYECCDSVRDDNLHMKCNRDTELCCYDKVGAPCNSDQDCCSPSKMDDNNLKCSEISKQCCFSNLGVVCNNDSDCCGYTNRNSTIKCAPVEDKKDIIDRCCSWKKCNVDSDCCFYSDGKRCVDGSCCGSRCGKDSDCCEGTYCEDEICKRKIDKS